SPSGSAKSTACTRLPGSSTRRISRAHSARPMRGNDATSRYSDRVEVPVGKRQRLPGGLFEGDLDARLARFLASSIGYLRRGIDTVHFAGWSHLHFGGDGKAAGAAADVQNCLTWLKSGEAQQLFAKGPLPPHIKTHTTPPKPRQNG